MGHSKAVHTATYQKGYDKQDVLQTLNLLDQQTPATTIVSN